MPGVQKLQENSLGRERMVLSLNPAKPDHKTSEKGRCSGEELREVSLHIFSHVTPMTLSHLSVQASPTGGKTFPERALRGDISAFLLKKNALSLSISIKMNLKCKSHSS